MKQIVVRLMSQRGAPDAVALASHMPGGSLDQGFIRFTVEEEPSDVTVVFNYLKYDRRITARKGYIWSWHNEPIVRKPFSHGFDRIFTHEESSDPRAVTAPPILDWWIGKSWDELHLLDPPPKIEAVSAIASTKSLIPGHEKRNTFIQKLSEAFPKIPIYGEGRDIELVDKWGGLAPYRYSLAIENSSRPHYWTEKVADCFLAFTVPIYYGATNLDAYFPRDSFIWLPIDQPLMALEEIRRTLETDSWEQRLPALTEARRRVLEEYSVFAQLSSRIRAEADHINQQPMVTTRVHGRRTHRGGWVRGVGPAENLKIQGRKLRTRLGMPLKGLD